MFSNDVGAASTIRFPSTANLNIDSSDRLPDTLSTDFSISKQENILAGFFSRFAITEMILDYALPNIQEQYGNNELLVTINGQIEQVILLDGYYTVALALSTIVDQLNELFTGVAVFSIVDGGGHFGIECTQNF
jgi:hypothetical protein